MNYELAKQLKDAGFPQELTSGRRGYLSSGGVPVGADIIAAQCYFPALEELIEACGERLILFETRGTWHASKWGGNYCADHYIDDSLDGLHKAEKPKEAVAKLWLAIHSK